METYRHNLRLSVRSRTCKTQSEVEAPSDHCAAGPEPITIPPLRFRWRQAGVPPRVHRASGQNYPRRRATLAGRPHGGGGVDGRGRTWRPRRVRAHRHPAGNETQDRHVIGSSRFLPLGATLPNPLAASLPCLHWGRHFVGGPTHDVAGQHTSGPTKPGGRCPLGMAESG
jgi:hypothetical protein